MRLLCPREALCAALCWLLWAAPAGTLRAQEAPVSLPLRVQADHLTLTPEGWSAWGSLQLSTQAGQHITATTASLRGHNLTLEEAALGTPQGELLARRLQLDLTGARLEGQGITLTLPPGDGPALRLRAASLQGGGQRWRLGDSQLTQRGLRASSQEAHWDGQSWSSDQLTTLALRGVPIWAWPSWRQPRDGRRAGLTAPSVGWLGLERTWTAGAGAFLPLGPSVDLSPHLWWRANSTLGADTHLRWADEDDHGHSRPAHLTLSLYGGADRGLVASGQGAWTPRSLPSLRHDGSWASSAQAPRLLRLERLERLGATRRGAALVGIRGEGLWLDAGLLSWQPRRLDQALGGPQGASSLGLALSGDLLLHPGAGLQGSLRVEQASHQAQPPWEGPRPGQQHLETELRLGRGLALGRLAAAWLEGRLLHTASLHEVPQEQGRLQPESAQRLQAALVTGAQSKLQGRLLGLRHHVKPSLWLWWLAVDDRAGELEAPQASVTRRATGRLSGQLRLEQRLGELRADLGWLWLERVRDPHVLRRRLSRAALALRWGGAWGRAELDTPTGRLQEAQIAWRWGGEGWALRGGGLHRTAGWRLGQRPEQSLQSAPVPGLRRRRPQDPVTGATLGVDSPLWPLEALSLRADVLLPVDDLQQWELQGGLYLGQRGDGWRLGLEVNRSRRPATLDILWTARYEGFSAW